MAVTWKVELTSNGDIIDEPYEVLGSTTYQFTITNTSTDKKATGVGFYIKEASTEGERDFPSSLGKVVDWYDILLWGNASPSEGAFLIQGVSTTQFTLSSGVRSTPLPLTVGSGPEQDEVEPGSSVTFSVRVVVPGSVSARRLFFDVELDYQTEEA